MCQKVTYWASVALSALALIVLIFNISVANSNRSKQVLVAQRQNTINGGQTLAQFSQSLIQSMAEAAVKNNDAALRGLLEAQGINIKADAPAKPAADKK